MTPPCKYWGSMASRLLLSLQAQIFRHHGKCSEQSQKLAGWQCANHSLLALLKLVTPVPYVRDCVSESQLHHCLCCQVFACCSEASEVIGRAVAAQPTRPHRVQSTHTLESRPKAVPPRIASSPVLPHFASPPLLSQGLPSYLTHHEGSSLSS